MSVYLLCFFPCHNINFCKVYNCILFIIADLAVLVGGKFWGCCRGAYKSQVIWQSESMPSCCMAYQQGRLDTPTTKSLSVSDDYTTAKVGHNYITI